MSIEPHLPRDHAFGPEDVAILSSASGCHVTEHRVVFIKDGRETDGPPIPEQAARRIKRASNGQYEHVAAPGLLSRVVALFRGQ